MLNRCQCKKVKREKIKFSHKYTYAATNASLYLSVYLSVCPSYH